jgi:hypothetical protein
VRTYSHSQELLDNIPYLIMIATGAAVTAMGMEFTPWAWTAAGAYAAYGVVGAVWIMVFVCPYCAFYDTRSCPCGYGQIAAKLIKRADVECFSRQFKKHIPVIVPLWLIPLAIGGWALYQEFSAPLVALMGVFAVDAYVILPLVSRQHGCAECPQRETCPWMGGSKS